MSGNGRVALDGCNVEFAFVLPHDHPLTGAGFPLYDDVVVQKDRGKTTCEDIDEDIAQVSLAELAKILLQDHNITWICLKPGAKNHRIYVFFSEKEAVPMEPAVKQAVDALIAETWGYGKISVIRSELGPDLINIQVVKPFGKRPPKHSFGMSDGSIEAFATKVPKPKQHRTTARR